MLRFRWTANFLSQSRPIEVVRASSSPIERNKAAQASRSVLLELDPLSIVASSPGRSFIAALDIVFSVNVGMHELS